MKLEALALTVTLSFAAGVLTMDIAHDLRTRPAPAKAAPAKHPAVLTLVCAHREMTRPTCGRV